MPQRMHTHLVRRHHRLTQMLITRHRLLTRSESGTQLLRSLAGTPGRGERFTPSVRWSAPIPPDDSTGAPDDLAEWWGQNTLPDSAFIEQSDWDTADQDNWEIADQPAQAAVDPPHPPASRPDPAPPVDSLVDLVRQMMGQSPPAGSASPVAQPVTVPVPAPPDVPAQGRPRQPLSHRVAEIPGTPPETSAHKAVPRPIPPDRPPAPEPAAPREQIRPPTPALAASDASVPTPAPTLTDRNISAQAENDPPELADSHIPTPEPTPAPTSAPTSAPTPAPTPLVSEGNPSAPVPPAAPVAPADPPPTNAASATTAPNLAAEPESPSAASAPPPAPVAANSPQEWAARLRRSAQAADVPPPVLPAMPPAQQAAATRAALPASTLPSGEVPLAEPAAVVPEPVTVQPKSDAATTKLPIDHGIPASALAAPEPGVPVPATEMPAEPDIPANTESQLLPALEPADPAAAPPAVLLDDDVAAAILPPPAQAPAQAPELVPEQPTQPVQPQLPLAATDEPARTPPAQQVAAPGNRANSPQEWAARLLGANRTPANPRTDQPQPATRPVTQPRRTPKPQREQPTPIPETTRRFLQPLVGIDPATVRIFRGVLADQVTTAQAADAVTVGADVFLAAQASDESPESLGVLAHELTHVARQREPRFVPPLLKQTPATLDDEEKVARSVEAQVVRQAQVREQQATHTTGTATGTNSAVPVTPMDQFDQPSWPQSDTNQPDEFAWGNLPAPWEPLPAWMSHSAAELPATPAPAAAPTDAGPTGAASTGATPAAAPTVQRAELGRPLDDVLPSAPTIPTAAESQGEAAQTEEPDLDALARQVYAILKQRLAAERRRTGF